jgi:hypothetical protein
MQYPDSFIELFLRNGAAGNRKINLTDVCAGTRLAASFLTGNRQARKGNDDRYGADNGNAMCSQSRSPWMQAGGLDHVDTVLWPRPVEVIVDWLTLVFQGVNLHACDAGAQLSAPRAHPLSLDNAAQGATVNMRNITVSLDDET